MFNCYSMVKLSALFLLTFFFATGFAQDKNLQAIAYYNKAETAFNNAMYEEALDYVKQAELTLGSTNSKLLYLKIQTLNLLAKINPEKTTELKRSIAQFYQYTDQSSYPAEKYLNITTIEIELKEQERMLKEQEKQEEADFLKAKNTAGLDEFIAFAAKYPNSKYMVQLKEKSDAYEIYKQQQAKEEEIKKRDEKKAVKPRGFYMNWGFKLEKWKSEDENLVLTQSFGKGASFEIGNRFFKKKNAKKKFQAGFDIAWVNPSVSIINYEKYQVDENSTRIDSLNSNAIMCDIQFFKMGPIFAWNLKKDRHFLFLKLQAGGSYMLSTTPIPPKITYDGFDRSLQYIGPVFGIRLEYMYRKLLIGISYQYSMAFPLNTGGHFEHVHQLISPTIGVKF
jgi:hypothetical protein